MFIIFPMTAENISDLKNRVAETCRKCGRNPAEITIVAVSKTFDESAIRRALTCGIRDIGESYVQEMLKKRELLTDQEIIWHFVGPLQRNKSKYLVDFVDMIHSIENMKVPIELEKRASRNGRKIDILIEVNSSNEPQKHGVEAGRVYDLIGEISLFESINLRGLMTMAPYVENPEDARPYFRSLAKLKKELLSKGVAESQLKHLSMGMSHDFQIAIEEGATIIRIGSGIFGERHN